MSEEAAKLRGSQIHLLLEILPSVDPADWALRSNGILSGGDLAAEAADIPALLAEVTSVLSNPDLAFLFGKGTLAEIPVSATLPELGGQRVHGLIDRLIIQPDRILAVDFKTNGVVPDTPDTCPEGILRQMGAYAAALRLIYPDRQIDTAILWTRTARLMPLSNDLVMGALRRSSLP